MSINPRRVPCAFGDMIDSSPSKIFDMESEVTLDSHETVLFRKGEKADDGVRKARAPRTVHRRGEAVMTASCLHKAKSKKRTFDLGEEHGHR